MPFTGLPNTYPRRAARIYEKLLADYHRIVGHSHANIFRTQEGLAECYEETGQIADAIELTP